MTIIEKWLKMVNFLYNLYILFGYIFEVHNEPSDKEIAVYLQTKVTPELTDQNSIVISYFVPVTIPCGC